MGQTFSTSESHSQFHLRPLRVPILKQGVYEEARDLASDLPGWSVQSSDDASLVLTCERNRGFLSGRATVTIKVGGPDGIPMSIVDVESRTEGGLPGFARDKANVLEFMKLFHRRVC